MTGAATGWLPLLALVAGALAPHALATLPPPGWASALLTCGLAAICFGRIRWIGLALLASAWVMLNLQERLRDRLDPQLAGAVVPVNGVVASLPEYRRDSLQFRFAPQTGHSAPRGGQHLPEHLLVRWYEDYPDVSVGETWRLELLLKPPWGPVNFQGADKERWLFAKGIGGLGTVRSGERLGRADAPALLLQTVRARISDEIDRRAGGDREIGIVRALAIADRSAMAQYDRELMTRTGTSHLLAISGLHIGLAAVGGLWLGRLLAWVLPAFAGGRRVLLLSTVLGLGTATCYALLAGLGVSTLRAVMMLALVLLASFLGRSPHPARPWTLALAGVLLVDPFAPLGAGFWFSFAAVGVLLLLFTPRTDPLPWWKTMLLAQAGVSAALAPVGAAWFQSYSPVSFAANLVAIPWVSMLVVPAVLGGVAALPFIPGLAGLLWTMAGKSALGLMIFLDALARFQGQLEPLPPAGAVRMATALAGGLLLLLPRGLPVRWLGLTMLAPLFMPTDGRMQAGSFETEVLDVGQGTAVIVQTPGHTLLYDSGPGDGAAANHVASIIAPALADRGGSPDRIVISHGDLDHAGGLQSLRRRYPRAEYMVNVRRPAAQDGACETPGLWRWDHVEFRVLHPGPWLPYMGNDSSCVISVRAKRQSLLLAGDVSSAVEQRLLAQGLMPHDVLLVPHHGSASSSSLPFIRALQPRRAIATASLGNRFGFPRPAVRRRYEEAGAQFWSTGSCGAIRFRYGPGGRLEAESARRVRKRIWRWPAAANCP